MKTTVMEQGPVDVNVRGWQPIETAPKDGTIVLVNDTTEGWTPWVSAYWIEGDEWSGWSYDDGNLSESNPLGPNPTHWMYVPPLPTPNTHHTPNRCIKQNGG